MADAPAAGAPAAGTRELRHRRGEQHSVRDFVTVVAAEIGLQVRWEGAGVEEKGYDAQTGQCIVSVDPRCFRPTEVETLLGGATKAREKLGWPPKIGFAALVREMMREDLKEAERDALCAREG